MSDGPGHKEDPRIPPELFIRVPTPVYDDLSAVLNASPYASITREKREGELSFDGDPVLAAMSICLAVKTSVDRGKQFQLDGTVRFNPGLLIDWIAPQADELLIAMGKKLRPEGVSVYPGDDAQHHYIYCQEGKTKSSVRFTFPGYIAGIVLEPTYNDRDTIRFATNIVTIDQEHSLRGSVEGAGRAINAFYLSLYEVLNERAQFNTVSIKTR